MNLEGVKIIATVANAHYAGKKVPKLVKLGGKPIAKTRYKRTDGWRGYWEVDAMPGWAKVGEGCHCGSYEDAPIGTSTREVEAELRALVQKHGEVVVVLCGGSNVFAMQFDVLAREGT